VHISLPNGQPACLAIPERDLSHRVGRRFTSPCVLRSMNVMREARALSSRRFVLPHRL
jgi:hypothetical protein